jgi:SOS-response transcriptional repressor LexA
MQEKSLQIEKILFNIREYLHIRTNRELAEILGVTEGTLSNWKRRGTIDRDLIIEKLDIPVEKLFEHETAYSQFEKLVGEQKSAPRSDEGKPSGKSTAGTTVRMSPNRTVPPNSTIVVRLFLQKVNAGKGVPLDTGTQNYRAVDASLVRNPDKAFCVFANGDSMERAGIINDSFLICEQTDGDWQRLHSKIVIASVNSVTVVKRLLMHKGKWVLRSESCKADDDSVLTEDTPAVIQGVVLSSHIDIENFKVIS